MSETCLVHKSQKLLRTAATPSMQRKEALEVTAAQMMTTNP
jgi:hypothetical protein